MSILTYTHNYYGVLQHSKPSTVCAVFSVLCRVIFTSTKVNITVKCFLDSSKVNNAIDDVLLYQEL